MIIRKAGYLDVDLVAKLHIMAFPNFFLSNLGYKFLCELYNGFLLFPEGVFYVVEHKSKIIGFIAGTTDPNAFFKKLRKKRWFYFLIKSFPYLIKNPLLVIEKLFSALFYSGDKPNYLNGGALLSSIGIDPSMQGKSIGKDLLLYFEKAMVERNSEFAYLITDEFNNDKVNKFYIRNGYKIDSKFQQSSGRKMVVYTKKLCEI